MADDSSLADRFNSWCSDHLGVDPEAKAKELYDKGKLAAEAVVDTGKQLYDEAKQAVQQGVQQATDAYNGAKDTVARTAERAVSKPRGPSGPLGLTGTVGRGGQNNPDDVRIVQGALRISPTGDCDSDTIAAIVSFQKSNGQSRPDGLVNVAGPTARALAGAPSLLDRANTAGKAIMDAESAAWAGTKSAYTAVTGAYDAVAPNPMKDNQDLGKLVDSAEAAAKEQNEKSVAQYGDVPVLGWLVKAGAAVNNATTDVTGGVVKGVGDLAAMAGNAMFHPIDAAVSMGEGALGVAEHVPLVPGMNTTVKGIHGAIDLARGKKDGEYGSSVGDLAQNLLMNTKQDPNDPSKKTSADLDFYADLGGGTQAWKDKPLEAAARTLTNLAPMFLGDDAPGGTPDGGPPAPEPVDPLGKTQVDPLGKTQVDPFGKTQVDLGKTQPDLGNTQPDLGKTQADPLGKTQPDGPPTDVDPAKPQPEPEAPKPDATDTKQIGQNLIDADAAYKASNEASIKALDEYVRYRQYKPNPGRGWEGDPSKWDPSEDARLEKQKNATQQASIVALNRLEAAIRAARGAGLKLPPDFNWERKYAGYRLNQD